MPEIPIIHHACTALLSTLRSEVLTKKNSDKKRKKKRFIMWRIITYSIQINSSVYHCSKFVYYKCSSQPRVKFMRNERSKPPRHFLFTPSIHTRTPRRNPSSDFTISHLQSVKLNKKALNNWQRFIYAPSRNYRARYSEQLR